ncbi:hypothetical protein ACROYT_G023935 [Oculina patagonica]
MLNAPLFYVATGTDLANVTKLNVTTLSMVNQNPISRRVVSFASHQLSGFAGCRQEKQRKELPRRNNVLSSHYVAKGS